LVIAEGDQLSHVAGVPDDQLALIVGTLGTGSANSLGNYATSIAVMPGNEATFKIEWLSHAVLPPRDYSNVFYLILFAAVSV
jgi:hypothetical protein